jgi:hypothetical protein
MYKPYYCTARLTCCLTVLLAFAMPSYAQDMQYKHMLRAYEDNDIIKLFGDISDKGYTNGTRFDYYYVKDHKSNFFIDNWMPKAGPQSVNTFGIGLMQTMYTPEDLTLKDPDVSDWPYTGALFLSHSLNSSNPVKTYSLNTEIIAGVMGKASMAEQMQKTIHKIIASDEPMGWDKQYPTDVLLNLNFSLEKQLWHYGHVLEVIGGGEGMAGTMINGASLYGFIRIGKIQPYFNGFIQQYTKPFHQKNKLQIYMIIKPALDWVGYNAVLQGGVFNGRSDYYQTAERAPVNNSISRRLDLEMVAGYGCASISFTQRIMPRLVDGFSHQRLGNISLHIAW